MARVRFEGNLGDEARKVRTGMRIGMRNLSQLAKAEIQKANPVDTGRSQVGWALIFDGGRLRGQIGNNVVYIKTVAEGLQGRRLSRKERKNVGFHQRGANKAIARAEELIISGLRGAGVSI